ncbi:MAG: pyridoxine 5'-phosphate synthase [Granulosicoccus sp.]
MKQPIYLGVNVDHVAAVRQARGLSYPDPVHAALQAELAGADSITMHLRADRRHIQTHDVERFAASGQTKLNIEMAATAEMLEIAQRIKPHTVCIVPENRQEIDTIRGVDVTAKKDELSDFIDALQSAGIQSSIFIDPDESQVEAAARIGAPCVQLHTGYYTDTQTHIDLSTELSRIVTSSEYAFSLGLMVNAGHGLHYDNVQAIAEIETINELRVGHSLITRALYWGLPTATSKMKRLMVEARHRS